MAAGKPFVPLLLELRGKRTQTEFAKWLGIGRTHVSNAESGERPGPTLISALVKRFPKRKGEIEEAVTADHGGGGQRREPLRSPETPIMKRARGLALHGRHREAVNALQAGIKELDDPEELVRCYRLLGDTRYALNEPSEAYAAWTMGLGIAMEAAAPELEDVMRNRIAGHLGRENRFNEALQTVDDGLARNFQSWKLWRRRGITSWLAHDFSPAFAALTAALEFGCPRQKALHARGQVLAEWGHYEEAVEELDEVIAKAETPLTAAYARNPRAFALGHVGKLDEAFAEFKEVESDLRESAWLHYFRARCEELDGRVTDAVKSYRKALSLSSPALNAPKRDFVEARLHHLGS